MRDNAFALDGFRPLDLSHKKVLTDFFRQEGPQTSELTLTNLFIWRHRYRPLWREWGDCLLLVQAPAGRAGFGLPPVGPGDKAAALDFLCRRLGAVWPEVRVGRVGQDFVDRFVDQAEYEVLLERDHSDYVYLTQDLINLPGRKYHKKKNHLNSFLKNCPFEYRRLDLELVECVLNMQEAWCQMKRCAENPALLEEDLAIYEALKHFEELDFEGGAILIEGRVEAFALGEPLNPETAVIHVEKANPQIRGLYAAINQRFCQEAWAEMRYINREQDLGLEGLRQAKESYYPHHLVHKYLLTPRAERRGG